MWHQLKNHKNKLYVSKNVSCHQFRLHEASKVRGHSILYPPFQKCGSCFLCPLRELDPSCLTYATTDKERHHGGRHSVEQSRVSNCCAMSTVSRPLTDWLTSVPVEWYHYLYTPREAKIASSLTLDITQPTSAAVSHSGEMLTAWPCCQYMMSICNCYSSQHHITFRLVPPICTLRFHRNKQDT